MNAWLGSSLMIAESTLNRLNGARVDCNGSWCVTDWRDVRWMVSGSVLRFQVLFLGGSIVMGARVVRVAGGGRSDWLQLNGDIFVLRPGRYVAAHWTVSVRVTCRETC